MHAALCLCRRSYLFRAQLPCAIWMKQEKIKCCKPHSIALLGSCVIQQIADSLPCKAYMAWYWLIWHGILRTATSNMWQMVGFSSKYACIEPLLTMPTGNITLQKTNMFPAVVQTQLCSFNCLPGKHQGVCLSCTITAYLANAEQQEDQVNFTRIWKQISLNSRVWPFKLTAKWHKSPDL